MPTDTLATRLRAAAETIKRRRETAKLPDDWHTIDLLRSAADALDAAERREGAFRLLVAYAECEEAYQYRGGHDSMPVLQAHGYAGKALYTFAGDWIDQLRARALTAAREGQP